MMKGLMLQQHQQEQQVILDENMSNLSSASGDHQAISVASSENRGQENGSNYPANQHQYFAVHPAPPSESQPAAKKKRNLPGNPDPEAEVIALSPKTLMATNRFVCEICNKGFQRDQNLQLHRRGHNLPWKLKQRNKNEAVRKKVYVCPEAGCVHHEPSRALGDLTGIKKHFCRKHGEKKWKCDKCSKKYAVQSDWKAHSKTCGTREYRCDCGTLFSRRDSFITHRAFCDALAEESARAITGVFPAPAAGSQQLPVQIPAHFNNAHHLLDPIHSSLLKKEEHHFPVPPWLSSSAQEFTVVQPQSQDHQENHHHSHSHRDSHSHSPSSTSTDHGGGGGGAAMVVAYHPTPSAHLSATALLQKAAQMGTSHLSRGTSATAPCTTTTTTSSSWPHQYQSHVSVNPGAGAGAGNNNSGTSGSSGLHLSSRDHQEMMALASYGNKAAACAGGPSPSSPSPSSSSSPAAFLLHHQIQPMNINMNMMMMMNMNSSSAADFVHGSTTFEDAFGQILEAKKEANFQESPSSRTHHNLMMAHGNGGVSGGNDGMTRDFLGLKALSHSDILSITGDLGTCGGSDQHPDQNDQENVNPA